MQLIFLNLESDENENENSETEENSKTDESKVSQLNRKKSKKSKRSRRSVINNDTLISDRVEQRGLEEPFDMFEEGMKSQNTLTQMVMPFANKVKKRQADDYMVNADYENEKDDSKSEESNENESGKDYEIRGQKRLSGGHYAPLVSSTKSPNHSPIPKHHSTMPKHPPPKPNTNPPPNPNTQSTLTQVVQIKYVTPKPTPKTIYLHSQSTPFPKWSSSPPKDDDIQSVGGMLENKLRKE